MKKKVDTLFVIKVLYRATKHLLNFHILSFHTWNVSIVLTISMRVFVISDSIRRGILTYVFLHSLQHFYKSIDHKEIAPKSDFFYIHFSFFSSLWIQKLNFSYLLILPQCHMIINGDVWMHYTGSNQVQCHALENFHSIKI